MQKRTSFLVALMLFFSTALMAQITTSSMNGKIVDENNDPVIGATVQVVHEPSGTRYSTVSNIDGRFAIQGMRTGGPYSVTITYIGYKDITYKDITLQLGEPYMLNANLSEDVNQLGEVIVTGTKSKFNAEKTGASTNINSAQITNLPTVNRGITEVTRLSPYGGNGMSFAGADGRTANFTVDGANFNNNFGLSENLPGGGNPISIDAIEELQVVISPYDVRQTNFIGGGVNAITKSGTNTFKGSAYIYHKNENMQGDAVKRQQIAGDPRLLHNPRDDLMGIGHIAAEKKPALQIGHGNIFFSMARQRIIGVYSHIIPPAHDDALLQPAVRNRSQGKPNGRVSSGQALNNILILSNSDIHFEIRVHFKIFLCKISNNSQPADHAEHFFLLLRNLSAFHDSFIQQRKNTVDIGQKAFPRFRQTDSVSRALKKPVSQLPFHFPDNLRKGRLRNIKRFGCLGDVFRPCDFLKILQMT